MLMIIITLLVNLFIETSGKNTTNMFGFQSVFPYYRLIKPWFYYSKSVAAMFFFGALITICISIVSHMVKLW